MQTISYAINAGRALQKEQTGLIHYCYQSNDGVTHDTIPTIENGCFALALFRSRLADNVLEGKAIIEKLLSFEQEGHFPVYLHEYPDITDTLQGLRLLPILFWLLADFSHVIEKSLVAKMHRSVDQIISSAKKIDLPKWAEARLDALNGKIGSMPESVHEWGEALINMQIAEKQGACIDSVIEAVFTHWHGVLHIYTGPALRRHHEGGEPELTLSDLFLSAWQKEFPKRAERLRPIHLRGAIIRPLKETPQLSEKADPFVRFDSEEESTLFIAWQGSEKTHTFVFCKKNMTVTGEESEFIAHFPEEISDKEDKLIEMNFFVDYHKDHEIFIEGEKATTFQMGQEVEIRCKEGSIKLTITGENGRFFGQIMRGNRPSQHIPKSEKLFSALDWRIGVRTISREEDASIRVRVKQSFHQRVQESPQPLPLHADHCPHTESSQ